ncbi:hypothetical protein PPYR_04738 [Photinus pyralis]|nr:PHD finger protein ALFIN-LIKE 4-like [Photinus pyralis]KAB0802552.1 hypothetical protein PPYR_04738 [Photinus pyralis]
MAEEETPSKMLDKINPGPGTEAVASTRKRGKQLASVLTSEEQIANKKRKLEEKMQKEAKKNERIKTKSNKRQKITKQVKPRKRQSSSSETEEEIIYEDPSDYEEDDAQCVSCAEAYSVTSESEDWIQCLQCNMWLHEGCTKYENVCDICGKKVYRKKK